ncbi:M48 family metalloprotease [Streptomyces sp. Tue6028]|uniref:M48 family metallopeptidase n=1 Tax=Streptomyces sp. Tue6028 TaxID=2036037 RepID=UPI003D73A513
MRNTAGETTQPCPECGAGIRGDSRFTVWCAACDWNVDPEGPRAEEGRVERARRALARRHGEKLFAEVTGGGTLRARRDSAAILAHVIALAVHGVTLAAALGGVWFLVRYWGGPGMLLGIPLLLAATALRPRFARLPENKPVLLRADAPALFALVDEIAQVAGTRGVHAIAVDTEINASVMPYGLRGRRLLTLGLPLWEILTPRQRIALLGHELGHYGNGDVRHAAVVHTALRSLTTWRYVFAPVPQPTGIEILVNVVYIVPGLLVQGLLMLLDQLTLRAAQRAEYLADREAAHAGSSEAAVGLMDRMLVVDSAEILLRREVNALAMSGPRSAREAEHRADEVWERLTAHMASIPEHEYERRRRAGSLRGHSVDATHPPTHLRRARLLADVPRDAAVAPDDDRDRRIAGELAAARTAVARRLIRDGLDG